MVSTSVQQGVGWRKVHVNAGLGHQHMSGFCLTPISASPIVRRFRALTPGLAASLPNNQLPRRQPSRGTTEKKRGEREAAEADGLAS